MSEEIKIVRCPMLTKKYDGGRTPDVIIKFKNNNPEKIMCPEFGYYIEIDTGATTKGCKLINGKCVYKKWKAL